MLSCVHVANKSWIKTSQRDPPSPPLLAPLDSSMSAETLSMVCLLQTRPLQTHQATALPLTRQSPSTSPEGSAPSTPTPTLPLERLPSVLPPSQPGQHSGNQPMVTES